MFSFVVIDYFHIRSQSSIYSVSVPFQESEKILTFLFPSCLPCCRKWQIFVFFRVLIHWIFWISGGMQLGGIYCKWALKIKFHFQLLSQMQVLHEKHKEIPPHERSFHFLSDSGPIIVYPSQWLTHDFVEDLINWPLLMETNI